MCPKDTIKGLAKDTRGNPESCFSKADESLGGSAVMLLPRTIPNPLLNSSNYCVLWFIGYLSGCDRARSLWIDNMLLIAAVYHLLRRSTGQLRTVKCHQVQVSSVCQQIHTPCSHPLPPASRCGHLMDAHRYLRCHAACGMLSVPEAHTLHVSLWKLIRTDAVQCQISRGSPCHSHSTLK